MEHETIISELIDSELLSKYLLFNLDETLYGVNLSLVLEIINIQKITKLPDIPVYIKGIVNLRGRVVPVIDVRTKFGMDNRAYDDKTCIVVLDVRDNHVGLIVDSVCEVVTVEPSQLSTPPTIGALNSNFLKSIIEIENKVVLNIDCDVFFEADFSTTAI